MISFAFAKVIANAILPKRANPYDAGMDLSSCENAVVPARGKAIVETGIAVQIPNDCYARIAPRSGLAAKNGIDVGAGVIDYGYTNSIKVILFNHTDNDFIVKQGDRIAQIIFEKIYIPQNIQEIDYNVLKNYALDNSARGLSGFGSTGV
jgi:deoxyuridine 5'-triphosphate nucleotidohydrolase